jgi:hypothetical protein
MFESITNRFGDTYTITVLSRDPWVVQFDDFISPMVCCLPGTEMSIPADHQIVYAGS